MLKLKFVKTKEIS